VHVANESSRYEVAVLKSKGSMTDGASAEESDLVTGHQERKVPDCRVFQEVLTSRRSPNDGFDVLAPMVAVPLPGAFMKGEGKRSSSRR